MGGLASLLGKNVYLDTNIFIHAAEGFAALRETTLALFRALDEGRMRAVTSELTLAELLVKPFEIGRRDIADLYEEFIQDSRHFTVAPLQRTILVDAARYRADLGLRLPDAIHVATAVTTGCSIMLSNDQQLRTPAGLQLLPIG